MCKGRGTRRARVSCLFRLFWCYVGHFCVPLVTSGLVVMVVDVASKKNIQ
jgi:hypothetical protein